jgi:hypothetical protein
MKLLGEAVAEFYGLDSVREDSNYSVYPLERGAVAYNLTINPVVGLETIGECC